ncbi:MAG: TetR/AcrR family transcriptional regulator [Bifidobacterium sp.]|jgi:AcrR family transcriptional regulator|nr:TetR/AcrR family transcriptional regulator [Bifidobacterium sp.]
MQRSRVRIPVQKRSIEKKRRIIDAAYRTFGASGYFAVTIPQIAQRAHLSTGTVYAYFHDKRDILLVCMQQFREETLRNFSESLGQLDTTEDLRQTVRDVLAILMNAHAKATRKYHNDMMSLKYSDPGIDEFMNATAATLAHVVIEKIGQHGYAFNHPTEQSLLAELLINAVQNELSWPQSPDTDYDRDIVIDDTADIIIAMVKRVDAGGENNEDSAAETPTKPTASTAEQSS